MNALQWVIVAFENSFLSVAVHDMKANMPVGNQGILTCLTVSARVLGSPSRNIIQSAWFFAEQVTHTPSVMNTLRRNLSRERIKYSITNPTLPSLVGSGGDANAFDNSSQTDKEIPTTRLTRVSSSSSISSSSKFLCYVFGYILRLVQYIVHHDYVEYFQFVASRRSTFVG